MDTAEGTKDVLGPGELGGRIPEKFYSGIHLSPNHTDEGESSFIVRDMALGYDMGISPYHENLTDGPLHEVGSRTVPVLQRTPVLTTTVTTEYMTTFQHGTTNSTSLKHALRPAQVTYCRAMKASRRGMG